MGQTNQPINEAEKLSMPILFDISVIITQKNDKPAVELRRLTSDSAFMKTIISCAYHGRPLIILPKFPDTFQSINTLQAKGIIYLDPTDNTFYFNI